MKVLVTGFQPFGTDTMNPAFEAVKLLPDNIAGAEVVKVEIPVVFYKGAEAVEAAIEKENPDIVICVGQAGGRANMTVERVAINLAESPAFGDNDGNKPNGRRIQEDGKDAYFANIPVKAMVKNMHDHGIPASISYSAGTYVCNDVMYNLLYTIDKKYPNIRGGFIHVPFDIQQAIGRPATTPSMPISVISEALRCCVEAAITNKDDIVIECGTTH
ncbi:MAG: pyroglutamyl-peptidase I [Clostridium sp.]|nr:pyroglutamyl-peptidase I [Clostridium sp.]